MIYFIQDQTVNLIKIGYTESEDVTIRLRTLQTGSPVILEILLTVPGGREVEQAIHRRFANAREHGEWFHPVPDLIRYIAYCQEVRAVIKLGLDQGIADAEAKLRRGESIL